MEDDFKDDIKEEKLNEESNKEPSWWPLDLFENRQQAVIFICHQSNKL